MVVFGLVKPKRLRGFPKGRKRIRMRNNDFVYVFVRPKEGGIRKFLVEERNGEWWAVHEQGANINVVEKRNGKR
jgi:hypothetical protein